MMTKLLKTSGLELDKNEQKIIEDEFLKMTKELEILSSFSDNETDCFNNPTPLSDFRKDTVAKSSNKDEVFSNSKSKNDDGFIIKKIL